ncbi:MAG TPA: DinB family protein [Acidimicrobiales bacterium]|nr:DinB family protein [Acidimicrobiales bacterium]
MPRPDESTPLGEMPMGRAWLRHLRESAIFKLEGLSDQQLRWQPAPTANSLGVIVVHLGYTERLWIRAIYAGEPMDMAWRSHMFELPDGWGHDEIVAFYRGETAAADAVLDRATSLDQPSAGDLRPTTLRWAVTHLVEETARHVGHMDITRELLDGRTGR